MGMGGQYTIRVHGMLDDTQIRAQLGRIQAQMGKMAIGGGASVGKGANGIAAVGKEANRTTAGVKRLNAAVDTTGKNVKKIEGKKLASAYTSVGKGAKQATSNVKTFGSTTLDVTKKVVQFGAVTAAIRGVTTGMGAMVQQTFELDSALTEFKKVSNLSGKGLEKYTEQAYKAGRATAKTGVEMIDAATQFKKMGYDESTSLQLAKHATMFQNIADAEISAGDAAKFINSQMKAYQGEFKSLGSEGEKAAKVIDTVNEVANKNAVGTNDLQLALTKTSAAMGGFGNSFDQVVGIMTAGTEIMVGMPSQVARGWRTIGANILQIAQSSDEYVAASGKVKIATRDQNGEMKNTYAMMKDLYTGIDGVSASWKDLSKEEQSAIALQLGGKNNMEKFRAVMDNFGTAIKATEEAQRSQGSATKENARFLDSMQGSLQNLKSAWSEFANAMVKSGTLKTMMNGLADFVRFMSGDFGQAIIKGGLSLVGLGAGLKLVGGIASLASGSFAKMSGVFGKFGKSASKVDKPLGKVGKNVKVMQKPLANGAKNAGKTATKFALLGGAFSKLAGILTSPVGLVAGMLALGAGIMYVNTKVNKAKSPEKQYEKTHKQLGKLEEKYKEVGDRIDELNEKRKKGTITSSEEVELDALEQEREEIHKNIEAYKELEKAQKTAHARTPDSKVEKTDKVKQHQRPVTKASPLGANIKQAEKDAGAVDLLTSKMVLYSDASKKVAEAEKNVADAREKAVKAAESGDPAKMEKAEKRLSKALEEEEGARKNLGKSFKDMKKANDELKQFYGSQERMPDDIRKSSEAVDKLLKSYGSLKKLNEKGGKDGVDFTGLSGASLDKTIDDFKTLGESIGVTVDESGKLTSVNFDTMSSGLQEMGYSADEARSALMMIGQTHPEARINVAGVEVAGKDVATVLDYLDKVDSNDPEATININGTDVAVSDIESVEDLAKKLNGEEFKPVIDVDNKKATKKTKKTTKEIKKFNKVKGKAKLDADNKKADKKVKQTTKGVKKFSKTKGKAKLDADSKPAEQGSQRATEAVETLNGKEAIAYLREHGGEAVKQEVNDVGETILTMPDGKTVTITETGAKGGEKNVSGLDKAIGKVKGKSVSVGASTSGKGGVTSLKSAIDSVKGKTVTVTVNYKQSGKKPDIPGKAKGTRNFPGGLAEVNEEGWEFIRDAKTGQLRIAGGGQRTVTHLNKGDAVYTHQESKRMIAQGEVDIRIPQHASGKDKKKAQQAYNKGWNKRKSSYEKALATLEYKATMQHWADTALTTAQKKLYDKRIKQLRKWNNSKKVKALKKKGAKVKKGFGIEAYRERMTEREEARSEDRNSKIETRLSNLEKNYSNKGAKRLRKDLASLRKKKKISAKEYKDYLDDIKEIEHDRRIDSISESLNSFGLGGKIKSGKNKGKYDDRISQENVSNKVKSLKALKKKNLITAQEYKDFLSEVYRAYLDNQMHMYETGRKTYADMKKDLLSYADSGKITWAEYYEYIEDLMEQQLSKEQERLEKLQKKNDDTYSLAKSWIDRKISQLEKENEETNKQNELIEKQNELEKARTQRIKVYRQGVGFVYEQDTQAVKDATTSLRDYKKEIEKSPELQAWEKIRDIFENAEIDAEIRNLEVLSGGAFDSLFGKFGTDESQWLTWVKNNLATKYGYDNLFEAMDELEGWKAIEAFLDTDGKVAQSKIDTYINNNRFASGSLATPAGFARVGEQGYEIALLGKGDSVMPHEISENLMAWGTHSPIEYASAMANTTSNAYHFDKLVLPNVTDANSLLNELNNLPNKALQYSRSRA